VTGWLAPLNFVPPPKPPERKRGHGKGGLMPKRQVVIKGKTYRSMTEAARALRCSYSKIYRLIGESWRVP